MIRNKWYAILEAKELPEKKAIGVIRIGEKLVLWRENSKRIACISDRCCHRGAQLSIGKLIGKDNKHIECPFHGFLFNYLGQCIRIPANGKNSHVSKSFKVNSYPVQEKYDFIWIWFGEKQEKYPEIQFFDELSHNFSYYTIHDHWSTHYSRAIENQLDVMHLPFIHHNTIGRGNKTLVHGPFTLFDSENNIMKVWFSNEIDDGHTNPCRPNEMQKPIEEAIVHFRFPNSWMLYPSEEIRIVIVFSPIDENNTILYLRLYQKIITRIPVLRSILNRLMMLFNRIILNQDKHVVITQEPKVSTLSESEKLIQGDLPIIIYRREREKFKKLN